MVKFNMILLATDFNCKIYNCTHMTICWVLGRKYINEFGYLRIPFNFSCESKCFTKQRTITHRSIKQILWLLVLCPYGILFVLSYSSLLCLILFYLMIVLQMPVFFPLRRDRKGINSDRGGGRETFGRLGRRRNHNQNILYVNYLFSIEEKDWN